MRHLRPNLLVRHGFMGLSTRAGSRRGVRARHYTNDAQEEARILKRRISDPSDSIEPVTIYTLALQRLRVLSVLILVNSASCGLGAASMAAALLNVML